MTASMQPKGRQTPWAVPKLPFFLLCSARVASSAQAAALAPQLAAVALLSGTTVTFFTCKGPMTNFHMLAIQVHHLS